MKSRQILIIYEHEETAKYNYPDYSTMKKIFIAQQTMVEIDNRFS